MILRAEHVGNLPRKKHRAYLGGLETGGTESAAKHSTSLICRRKELQIDVGLSLIPISSGLYFIGHVAARVLMCPLSESSLGRRSTLQDRWECSWGAHVTRHNRQSSAVSEGDEGEYLRYVP